MLRRGSGLASPFGGGGSPNGLTERVTLVRSPTFPSPSQSKIKDFCQLPQRGSQGVGCARKRTEKLEFDVIIIRRAYVMTPPTRCKFPIGWLNGKRFVHPVGRGLAPAKTYLFCIFWWNGSRSNPGPSGGGEPPPYGTPRQTPIYRATEQNR